MSLLTDVFKQGTHAARPAAASGNTGYYYFETDTVTLFQSTGSAWTQLAAAVGGGGGGGGTPTILLDYVAATDIASSAALTTSTWTDVGTNQTFTPASASSRVEIIVSGFVYASANSGGSRVRARAYIDSAGTPISKPLGGAECTTTFLNNILGSGGSVYVSGLAASAHTVKVQIYTPDNACTFYCRANTQTPAEGLNIQVIEHL